MNDSIFPLARRVSDQICSNWIPLASKAAAGMDVATATVPDAAHMAQMIDAGFWTSLRHEEGYTPTVSLALIRPEETRHPLTFARRLPLTPESLTRLGPAVERPGIHLGVSAEGGELSVWGAVRPLPPFCFVLEVVAPGLLVIKKARGEGSGKFINIAVIDGADVKIIDQRAAAEPDCPELLTSLLGFDSQYGLKEDVNILIQLAISMRAHRHGGSLLVVPSQSDGWRESIAHPIAYSASPPFAALTELMAEDTDIMRTRRWQDSLRRAVDGIAGLTAIDGATVMTNRYELLAFGVKIIRRAGLLPIESVAITEPIEKNRPDVMDPTQLGGTRHMSAAQFVHDQKDSIALVASQDGRFTVFAWSPLQSMVHGHRIESLLL
ncbi:MAG: hypothetical protein IT168_13730 [Bryobacterales bacterium]|nr:hypothetical protein [Bryobacterales bacterium]